MNERELIKKTSAYKIIENDKIKNTLSHAYLIICQDEIYLRTYLKYLASLILSEKEGDRADKLILAEKFADCSIYPEPDKNIVVSIVAEMIEKTMIKPLESDKRVFILSNCEKMNITSQNKLLKTLEEPPKNVIILMGTSREYSLLPTVKSRVKILEIPLFSEEEVLQILKHKFEEREDLSLISTACGGLIGKAEEMAQDESFKNIEQLAYELTMKMLNVKDILDFSERLIVNGKKIKEFLAILKIVFYDMLMYKSGKSEMITNKARKAETIKASSYYDIGAILNAIEKINMAEKDLFYNSNTNMQIESLLLSIMEGKYKWQKL
jgi:DNA polymerase-3 subunit delta'